MNHITDNPNRKPHPKPQKRLGLFPVVLLLSLALIAVACSSNSTASSAPIDTTTPSTTATPPTTSTSEPAAPAPAATSDELEAYFDELENSGFGGVVAVREGPNITTRAFGTADRENDVPVDDDTVFDIASITKQFTAAAILRLEMDGRLSVDDTLGEHVPGLPDDKAAITLHQLLTNTAGLPNGLGFDDEPIGRSDYLALVGETPLLSEPGDRYEYSNVGFSLLAAVIEFETGQPYEQYLRTALFEPAGMLDTGYVLPEWDGQTIAVGYYNSSTPPQFRRPNHVGDLFGRPNEQTWDVDGPYWHLRGNGGLLSTAGDMLRWDEALVGDQILDATAKTKFFAAHVPQDDEVYYGYGWQIIPTATGSPLITHNGGNHIFYADFLRLVDQDVAVFMATNSSHDADGDVVFEVANIVLDGGLEAMFEEGNESDSDSDPYRNGIADPDVCLETLPSIELECGRLTVPVDHDEPAGDTMSLPYVVLPALADNPDEEPLVFLQGGPGESTLAVISLFTEEPAFRDRDMIFLEQRGIDPSGLFLRCDSDLQDCRDDYVADGIDLSAFTTLNAAKDLALLRDHLGIERWHLLGASYGTTLAMVAMDNDPEGTASVILDGPTAPDVIIFNADVESILNAYSKVFAGCAADADCGRRNPDLFDTHLANFDVLADEPLDISTTALAELFGPTIDALTYLEMSDTLLGDAPGYLPAVVTAIAQRDVDALLGIAGDIDAGDENDPIEEDIEAADPGLANGLYHSIYCAEEAPFFDRTNTQIETVDDWPAGTIDFLLPPVEQRCEAWDVDPADASDVDQVVSSIPTLILAGEYDHLTPLRQGEIAAAGLSDVELIEVPSTGHTTIENDCARSIMVDFLRAPGGDRSCLAEIAPIEWK